MLTPADVEQKTFSTALRGYDLDEVDDFLDEVVTTIRSLTEQLEEARSGAATTPAPATVPAAPEVEEAPPEVTPPEPSPKSDIDETAIGRALVAAQTAADRLLEEAEAQAERIVEEAQTEADSWTAEREEKRREAEAEISALAARVASVRSELSVLAGEVAEKLDDMDTVIESGKLDDDESDDTGDTVTGLEAPGDEDAGHDGPVVEGEVESSAPEDVETSYDDEEYEFESGQEEGESADDAEEGSGPRNGGDHLDEILTGVAADLQLGSRQSRDDAGHSLDREDSPDDRDSPDDGVSPDDEDSPDDIDSPDGEDSPY